LAPEKPGPSSSSQAREARGGKDRLFLVGISCRVGRGRVGSDCLRRDRTTYWRLGDDVPEINRVVDVVEPDEAADTEVELAQHRDGQLALDVGGLAGRLGVADVRHVVGNFFGHCLLSQHITNKYKGVQSKVLVSQAACLESCPR
jgi:hypothetical protein